MIKSGVYGSELIKIGNNGLERFTEMGLMSTSVQNILGMCDVLVVSELRLSIIFLL